MNLKQELIRRISAALAACGAPEGTPALLGYPARAEFGDYQANGVMAAAKALKTNPRDLAQKVVAAMDLSDLAAKVEVAGPGFINITLKSEFLNSQLASALADERLGVSPLPRPQTVVVDYSSPNLAKEMHVGHLRSTIIGDALARTLKFIAGEPLEARQYVIPQNHVGDWGTQFGMLLAYLKDLLSANPMGTAAASELSDLEEFYRKAKARFDADAAFADAARQEVVILQSGDTEGVDLWNRFREVSMRHCQQVYERLGTLLCVSDVRGESTYNDMLPGVVEALKANGMLQESQGAQCVFLDEFKGKGPEDSDAPLIVQKTDGGYLYATTDLAAIRYRVGTLHADRVLYVTDSRQGQHFEMVFLTARKASFAGNASLEHVPFGMMLGADRRPFKTREGGTVKLMDLLDEAIQRARDFLANRRAQELADGREPSLTEEQIPEVARVVGIGAVKYSDLSQNRASDYVFSWDKMLSLDGNTAPYMQYAYARIRSIFRKGASEISNLRSQISVTEPAERALAVKLAQFPETVQTVADDCLPNVLCAYLYDVAGAFMSFYEACPVLKADEPARSSRLALCDLTARIIKTGLGLLGIETIEQM
ncbi:MAG: arginine--tRNA ligase [Planctomycetaceae bacterium]